MSYREIPVNACLGFTKAMASAFGLKLDVELSDHSIEYSYTLPDKDTKAWDLNLYRNGNLFPKDCANPIKPYVIQNEKLENPNEIAIKKGKQRAQDGSNAEDSDTREEEEDSGPHVAVMSSSRYRDYMRQDLVSQLLTPKEQWKIIAYGVLGLGILAFFQMLITLYVNGAFN